MICVSVIVPYYKKKNYIKKTINSIKLQSYKNLEIIIIYDDEDIEDRLQRYEYRRHHAHQTCLSQLRNFLSFCITGQIAQDSSNLFSSFSNFIESFRKHRHPGGPVSTFSSPDRRFDDVQFADLE